jgi:ribose transport system substrate-binding protein
LKKQFTVFAVFILCTLLLTACAAPGGAVKKELVFGYSTPSLQNSFWITVKNAMQKAADENGVKLLLRDAASDNAKQAADIEDFIEQRVDAILFTPYDSVSLSPSVKNVNKAGIPVVIVDIGMNDQEVKYDSLIITDNLKGGNMAGQWLSDYIKNNNIKNPTVATIEAQLGAQNARERHKGFLDVMQQNGIPVVAGQSAFSLRDKAMIVMEDFLQANPNLTAVFAECDDMALGALQAVKQSHAETVIIGYDGNFEACQQIAAGTNLMADIDQQPQEMGRLAVEIAMKMMRGEKVNKQEVIEPILIDRQNVRQIIKNIK